MSSTRSPSRKAPATEPAAVIVSHGQPSDPDPAEAALADLAARVRRILPGWRVGSATLASPGALAAALAAAGAGAVIYPMFMTNGWFTSEALVARLQQSEALLLPPFGRDPALPVMTARLLRRTLEARDWQARETTLFIAAHGSGRSPTSARDSRAFAAALERQLPFAETRIGFVEQPPRLAQAGRGLGSRAICLPFFAARGSHVTEDLPDALEEAGFEGLCLDPLGEMPEAAELIAGALAGRRAAA